MRKIIFDFETYSVEDISKSGSFKYADHPSTRILCMSYKIDDAPTQLWIPSMDWPKELIIQPEDKLMAFNATFEYLIWNRVGVRLHPEFFKPVSKSQFIDIQAICARYKFPIALGKVAIALDCTKKLESGTRLIRICCSPGHYPTQKDYEDLYHYCIVDTDVTAEVLSKLPVEYLTPLEQELWELTLEMNERGVPIDEKAVSSILEYLAIYMDQMKNVLPEVTKGYVQTVGQIKKIRDYCSDNGVKMPNLQVETVKEFLGRDDLPDNVRTVLEIRQLTGMTSIKKFITIHNMVHNGYVHGNLFYHGAGTGRWSGRGFQFHNLPRAKTDEPEEWIKKFIAKEPIEKPIDIAKALIRPMIMAPDGYKLIVSDYSSIENRVLAWLADDWNTLKLFTDGICQYSDMASYLYKVPVEQIGKKSNERQMGKVIILGCGYQMGKKRFQAVAADWGFNLTLSEAESIVNAYRAKYQKVVRMWQSVNNAAQAAVRQQGKMFKSNGCFFKVVMDRTKTPWLRITLPSKRGLMYAKPSVEADTYGPVVKYKGFNSKIHQMASIALTPGLITENIVQATARDLLAIGKLNIRKYMPEVQLNLSVHDEAGGLIKDEDIYPGTMDKFNRLLCLKPEWAEGLPLEAEGYIEKRYKKD